MNRGIAHLAVSALVVTVTSNAGATTPSDSPWRVDAWVTALLAEPLDATGPLSDWGYGVSLGVGARPEPLPLSFGAEIAGVHWGTIDVPVTLTLGDTPTPALVAIRQQTAFLDLWTRAQFPRGLVRPYVELVGGLTMLDTKYTLRLPGGEGSTSVFADDTAPASTLGVGLGVDVMLARADDDPDAGILLTLGVRHLWGSRVSLRHATLGTLETDTDTVLVSLGIALKATRLSPGARSASSRD